MRPWEPAPLSNVVDWLIDNVTLLRNMTMQASRAVSYGIIVSLAGQLMCLSQMSCQRTKLASRTRASATASVSATPTTSSVMPATTVRSAPSNPVDDTILSPEEQSAFCLRIEAKARAVRVEAHKLRGKPATQVELIERFRMRVDKCGEAEMRSVAVCQLFSEFAEASAKAFAPMYGGAWDGWGIWIKQECIFPMLAFRDPVRTRRLRTAYEETLQRLAAIAYFERTYDKTVEMVSRSLLMDGLNGIASNNGPAELKREASLALPRFETVYERYDMTRRLIEPHWDGLVDAHCGLAKARGQQRRKSDCQVLMNGVLDEIVAHYISAVRDNDYRGIPSAVLRFQ